MRWQVVLFWVCVAAALACGAWVHVMFRVSETYHPMAAHGDLLHPLRLWSAAVPLAIAFASIAALVFWRRPLPSRLYVLGMWVMGIGVAFPYVVPPIDNGYKQVYWIGDKSYAIPWIYGPYNGQETPGGEYFLIRVSPHDLAPQYERPGHTIILGVYSTPQIHRGRNSLAETCTVPTPHGRFECRWTRNGVSYGASGERRHAPNDPKTFMAAVADMLDSFATDQNEGAFRSN